MKKLLFSLFALLLAGRLFAADPAADFSTANKLYAEGNYSGAAGLYEIILGTGVQSPALLFNCASAEFKAGHLGRAIAGYRRAEQLAPHDAEIRASLAFVRSQVQGATIHRSPWQGWLDQFSLNEWTSFAVFAFWLTFLLLAARQFKPALAAKLRTATWTFAVLTIFFGAVLGLQAANYFSRPTAVVLADGVSARSGPFDEAQMAFVVHDGAELSVVDRHENWVQVAAGPGRSGWLPVSQVAVLPGD